MLTKIAWRNVWRNRRRSWVLITAVAVGVFSFVGMMAYADGFVIQMVDAAINLQGGHLQVAAEGYHANPTVHARVQDAAAVEAALDGVEGVRAAPLVETPGMINSAEQAAGVRILGVDPAREAAVSTIDEMLVEGAYLEAGEPAVLLGAKLAERLNVRLGERIVLMASDLENEVGAGAYRVGGLFRTNSTEYDRTTVFLPLGAARDLLGYGAGTVSAYTVRLDAGTDLDAAAAALRARLRGQGLEVVTWAERVPMLVMMREMYDVFVVVLVVILFSAIAFTLVNSFLMVIFERIKEIGIMTANGVRPRQVRRMLFLEAAFIVALGLGLGGGLGAALIAYWRRVGLDLSAFADGLNAFGASAVVYPYVDWGHLALGFATILVMVALAVLYPAVRASRFNVVEAINHV